MGKEDFMQTGLEMGPAIRLAKKVQALKDNTKRSYKSLSEVLAKYDINSDVTLTQLRKFSGVLTLHSSRDKNMGPVVDNNEVMRCEYISTILQSPQMTVTGAESSDRVDYAIKKNHRWFIRRNNLHN
ncbi:11603_t:CDS:2 [Funneliformis caledonium]|uniref:11603_t:CDS:1 n=1 Tax=Funneliformis caledonium TaxID=1117310 RepID=A0A9N8W275_9GLOM|nr:11603_t:CDS:2 [Funneliformis caledonium]